KATSPETNSAMQARLAELVTKHRRENYCQRRSPDWNLKTSLHRFCVAEWSLE
ncbi:hypothetical protein J6590_105778, partial [Homalodisca vitripennis]